MKAFDGKITGGVVQCSMLRAICFFGFSLLTGSIFEWQARIFPSTRNTETRGAKIHLLAQRTRWQGASRVYPVLLTWAAICQGGN